ncbi:MAG TPA: hypothetical protein VGB68_14000, partial [Pyrinomonadaceae bacterium]
MLKNIFLKFALLILSFAAAGTANVFAQANSCAVKLDVSNFDRSGAIKNAQATALNIENKQVYRSALKDGMPYFAQLTEGKYDLTVTKAGFKQTKESYTVWCAQAEEGVLLALMLMEKGSSKETFTVPKFKFGD